MTGNKIKLNILDVSVILIIVFFIVGSVVRYQLNSSTIFNKNKYNAIVTIEVTDTEKILSKAVKSGDVVCISDKAGKFGTVTTVVNRNNKNYVLKDGEYQTVITDDLYRVLIKIEADVFINENGVFSSGNTFIAPGSVIEFETENAVFEGTVTSIKHD